MKKSAPVSVEEIVEKLKSLGNPDSVKGMAQFGINPSNTLGIAVPVLRKMAGEIGRNHETALRLWESGIHEARVLSCMIDVPALVTEAQMENWAMDFDSWDVCDQCCMNLFDRTSFAYRKAVEWSRRDKEFVKRAGFALMASLAVHDKKAGNEAFLVFLPEIKNAADDNRNFVKKAVNWALRQIGKRNLDLNRAALATAEEIRKMNTASARWIASDAIKELSSEAVQAKLSDSGS